MSEALIHTNRNLLKAIRFERPDYIPMTFHINDACWNAYPQDLLFELIESHPFLFPDFKRPPAFFVPEYLPNARSDQPYRDPFGSVWVTTIDGITGTVKDHPLENWDNFAAYRMPDPEYTNGIALSFDWEKEKRRIAAAKKAGSVVYGGLRHGHTFLQLCDLRGYENLLIDMVEEEPNLIKLIEKLEAFNYAIVKKYVDWDCDLVTYAEDLGMQYGPMISPDLFVKYIKPSYQRMMKPAREKGIIVHMHSDGDVRLLADELIDGGVDVVNLQDLVNGIDWLAQKFSGRICVDLDIDRARITAQGNPAQIDALILEEVQKLGAKEGGLSMIYGLYPGVPPQNIKALMDAMEKYAFYYSS
jgi:hypothetical protein